MVSLRTVSRVPPEAAGHGLVLARFKMLRLWSRPHGFRQVRRSASDGHRAGRRNPAVARPLLGEMPAEGGSEDIPGRHRARDVLSAGCQARISVEMSVPGPRCCREEIRIAVHGDDTHQVSAGCPQYVALEPTGHLGGAESYKAVDFSIDVVGFDVDVYTRRIV